MQNTARLLLLCLFRVRHMANGHLKGIFSARSTPRDVQIEFKHSISLFEQAEDGNFVEASSGGRRRTHAEFEIPCHLFPMKHGGKRSTVVKPLAQAEKDKLHQAHEKSPFGRQGHLELRVRVNSGCDWQHIQVRRGWRKAGSPLNANHPAKLEHFPMNLADSCTCHVHAH